MKREHDAHRDMKKNMDGVLKNRVVKIPLGRNAEGLKHKVAETRRVEARSGRNTKGVQTVTG